MREAAALRASAPITVSDGITVELALPRRAGRLAEIKLANHGVKTALIELHLEMLRGSIVSTCIKCDSFIYGRALSPLLVVVAPINSTTARRLVSGRPRQFCVIWQNSRCSILFHFDVPGG